MVIANVTEAKGSLVIFPDFGGNTFYARTLVRQLSRDVTCYVMRFSPDMVDRLDRLSVEDIGLRFATDIMAAGIASPIHLIGHSFAGFLAYETGRQMAIGGAPPEKLWILDLVRHRRPELRELVRDPWYHAKKSAKYLILNWRMLLLRRHDPDILAAYGVWRVDMKLHPKSYRYILRCLYSAMLAYSPS
ncbi:MAG: thioesterase domain-containing protein, partial [Paracoccaceae bacterium]